MRPLSRNDTHLVKANALYVKYGAIAQLGERLHGMQEVGGSIPPGSTISRSIYGIPRPVNVMI